MFVPIILATSAVALISLVGVLCFGGKRQLIGFERYVVPAAVGVFLALVLIELIPETLAAAPTVGGLVIGAAFITVYIIAHLIHRRLHQHGTEHNEKKEAAILILFGDAIHNFADGVLIAGGFFVSVEAGIVITAAVIAHELPQEIVEFGVLMRAGYSRSQAALLNLFSASTAILGALFAVVFASVFASWIWVLPAFVAGNLLYVAASELLPRLHSARSHYGDFKYVITALLLGFGLTAGGIFWSHEYMHELDTHAHADEEMANLVDEEHID